MKPDKPSYRLSKTDLSYYEQNGGTMLFVVALDESGVIKIYYNSLLPFDIKRLLNDGKDTSSLAVPLHLFPTEYPDKMTDILVNFVNDQKKQYSTTNTGVLSIDDLGSSDLAIDHFEFGFTTVTVHEGNSRPEAILSTKSFYIYAAPKSVPGVYIPVDHVNNPIVFREVNAPIAVDGKSHYTHYTLSYKDGVPHLTIGKSVTIKMPENGDWIFSHKPCSDLSQRIIDTQFLVALYEKAELQINGTALPLSINDEGAISSAQKHLRYLENISLLLSQLGVTQKLHYKQIKDNEHKLIYALIQAILYKQPI